MSTSDRARAARIVADHPVGETVAAYVDPANPLRAVLRRGADSVPWTIALFLTPFNAAVVAVWTVAAVSAWRVMIPSATGHVVRRRAPRGVRYRLHSLWIGPWFAALLGFGAAGFAMTFVVVFTAGFHADPRIVSAALALAAAVGAAALVFKARRLARSRWLEIDRTAQTLTIPARRQRKSGLPETPRVIPLDRVTGVGAIDASTKARRGTRSSQHRHYGLVIEHLTENNPPTAEDLHVQTLACRGWLDGRRAVRFADHLAGELGVPTV